LPTWAYNGRLPELGRPLRNISGIAVLNSAVVHLIVGPHARARSIDDLHARRHRPIGTGNATTSELLLSNYAVAAVMRDVGAALRLNPSVQGARGGGVI